MRLGHVAGEAFLFLSAVAAGVYGWGRAFAWLGTAGRAEPEPLWLGVSAIAWLVLARQMGRVHDLWPHRRGLRRGGGNLR